VVLCFIGLERSDLSEKRVAMRVSQGGHDAPSEKLQKRFPRTMANLKTAVRDLPLVFVYDNSDPNRPFREVAVFRRGRLARKTEAAPAWLDPLTD